jgi:transcription antitermination protein NusB
MGVRRKAREVAVQTLYSLDFSKLDSIENRPQMISNYQENFDAVCENNKIKKDSGIYEFAKFLLENVFQNRTVIDEEIESFSEHWSLERITPVDKGILRIAVGELLFTDTEAPVIINEAIEIAKKFCSESSSKFINGILHAVKEKNKL